MAVRQVSPRKWQIDYYPEGRKGKRERLYFIGTEAEALKHEMDLRRTAPSRATVNAPIRELLPRFYEYYENEKAEGTVVDARFAWKRLAPVFASLPICRLTPALIETYKKARLVDGVKKRTINRELTYLQAVITWAEESGHCNPLDFKIRKFPKKDTEAPIPEIPPPDKIQELLEAALPGRQLIFLLMYDNGLRKSEALQVKKSDVNFSARLLRVKGKGGKEALIPITTERLLEELAARISEIDQELARAKGELSLLRGLGKDPERAAKLKTEIEAREAGYLFLNLRTGKPYKDIRKSLATAARRGGVDTHLTPHTLRHSFGTHAMNSGVSQKAIQGILRHADLETTDIYTHLSGDFLRGEAAKFAGYIGNENRELTTVVNKKRKKTE